MYVVLGEVDGYEQLRYVKLKGPEYYDWHKVNMGEIPRLLSQPAEVGRYIPKRTRISQFYHSVSPVLLQVFTFIDAVLSDFVDFSADVIKIMKILPEDVFKGLGKNYKDGKIETMKKIIVNKKKARNYFLHYSLRCLRNIFRKLITIMRRGLF